MLGAGQHQGSTSAVHKGVCVLVANRRRPKTQPLRPNGTELNRYPAGSIPVSATNKSTTYKPQGSTGQHARRARMKPTQMDGKVFVVRLPSLLGTAQVSFSVGSIHDAEIF
jgi:hypothetical protein